MEFGRSGHLGVCAHSLVVEAKELEQGHVYLLSMGEDHVMDLKHNISLAILLFALVSIYIYRTTVCYLLGQGWGQCSSFVCLFHVCMCVCALIQLKIHKKGTQL